MPRYVGEVRRMGDVAVEFATEGNALDEVQARLMEYLQDNLIEPVVPGEPNDDGVAMTYPTDVWGDTYEVVIREDSNGSV